MGKYSVPESIRRLKPKGTMVKAINGHYYVYEYQSVVEDGKRKTRMGRCVGKIDELGFTPNQQTDSVSDECDSGSKEAELRRLRLRVAELECALRQVSLVIDRVGQTFQETAEVPVEEEC